MSVFCIPFSNFRFGFVDFIGHSYLLVECLLLLIGNNHKIYVGDVKEKKVGVVGTFIETQITGFWFVE